MKCKSCGAAVELTLGSCPACGAHVELGRLTGILGIVCRACDAYNEPGAARCAGCGAPLATEPAPPLAAAPGLPAPAAAAPPLGAPVIRTFQKPSPGAPTRVVPSILPPPAAARPASPVSAAPVPVPRAPTCSRCGAEARSGRFCSQCGQALEARATVIAARSMPPPRGGGEAGPGAGAPPRRAARLVLDAEGGTFPLDGESVSAGRSSGAILFPDDPCLAPHHATFFWRGGALHVRDEGAPGGVHLALRGLSVPLRAGDQFVAGGFLLRYAGSLPPPAPPSADGTRRLGAPRPAPPAVVVEECLEGGGTGRVFVRSGPSVTLGGAGCAVSLGDLDVPQAEVAVEASGAARLRDLGSPGGTYVRLPAHAERELRDGDRVRLGRQVLRVCIGE